MKLCRFDADRLGVVSGDRVFDVTYALDALPHCSWPLPRTDALIEHLENVRARIEATPLPAVSRALAEVVLRSPVANPPKIVAAPVNYRAHVAESEADAEIHANRSVLRIDAAGLFLKAPSSLVGPGDGIVVHFPDRRTDHEVELAVVIGQQCKNVPEADALDVVAGYCIGLDITIRGSEDRSFRKSLDTYTVLGPWLTTADEVADPDRLRLRLTVNGAARQDANTSQLIFSVRKLIAWASEWYTLHPGDVLLTGTPEGVGPIAGGDTIDASIENLGSMRVAVAAGLGAPAPVALHR
jgi:2-keto-4-pentenoate hydratase/2-oxohepta-3-ene-1,7-dioic acid hydratase in catechol pathway